MTQLDRIELMAMETRRLALAVASVIEDQARTGNLCPHPKRLDELQRTIREVAPWKESGE